MTCAGFEDVLCTVRHFLDRRPGAQFWTAFQHRRYAREATARMSVCFPPPPPSSPCGAPGERPWCPACVNVDTGHPCLVDIISLCWLHPSLLFFAVRCSPHFCRLTCNYTPAEHRSHHLCPPRPSLSRLPPPPAPVCSVSHTLGPLLTRWGLVAEVVVPGDALRPGAVPDEPIYSSICILVVTTVAASVRPGGSGAAGVRPGPEAHRETGAVAPGLPGPQ